MVKNSAPHRTPPMRRGALLVSAAAMTAGAGAVHLAGAPARLAEAPVLGGTAVVLGVAGLALGAALLATPSRRLATGVAAANVVMALLWAAGHTVGVPVGAARWMPEPLSVPDLVVPGLELLAALLLAAAAARARRARAPRAWRTALLALPAVLLTAGLATGGALAAPDDTWLPSPGPVAAAPGRTTTVTYCAPGGQPLAMDVTEPAASAPRPAPAVLYVHGGGWFIGDRQVSGPGAGLAGQDGALFVPIRDALVRRGFAVASIDYRLTPLHPWPAPMEDAECAVRFLRAHAGDLGVDPDRIGAWGSSAGGHMAAMLGTEGRVQAVVDMFGPTDLNRMNDASPFGRFVMWVSFGSATAEQRAAAGPVDHVTPGGPPFLILHGTTDPLVPAHHSDDLATRLRAAGTPAALVMVQGTGHSVATPGQRPSPAEVTAMVVDFFARTLAG